MAEAVVLTILSKSITDKLLAYLPSVECQNGCMAEAAVVTEFFFPSSLSDSSADKLLEGIDLDALISDSTAVLDPDPTVAGLSLAPNPPCGTTSELCSTEATSADLQRFFDKNSSSNTKEPL